MTNPPPRKRFPLFRIKWHLSTAIVMMFVAGALIWANLKLSLSEPKAVGSSWLCRIGYGYPAYALDIVTEFFPYTVSERDAHERLQGSKERLEAVGIWGPQRVYKIAGCGAFTSPDINKFTRRPVGLAIDGLFATALLFAVWFLCEWLIRSRAARKGG